MVQCYQNGLVSFTYMCMFVYSEMGEFLLENALASYCCCNKLPQT